MADISVLNFNGTDMNVKDAGAARSSAVAPVEDGSTSSAAYSIGDYIYRNGKLYKVTAAISIGGSFVVNTNITETDISNEFGSSISKNRYTITATNWSNSADANGYYTYSVTLNPTLSTSYAPNVYIAGANDSTFSTDTEKEQFALLDECDLTASNTLVLYAKTKPESTFYVFIEGQVA